MRKFLSLICGLTFFSWFGLAASPAALIPNATYTITIQKMNSNGTVSDYSTTVATADSDGNLSFTLSSIPTNNDSNFIVILIQDSDGRTVRKGFVPAPAPGATNLMGANSLSTVQTDAILAAGEAIGSDDPIPMAYLLTILRSDQVTESESLAFAQLGKIAIMGSNGFEGFLLSNGVTASKLSSFKSYLIYNPTAGKKTIADLTAAFKTAVDSKNDTTAKQEMQKAGALMADVFIDAAASAGIDLTLILAAHDAAGNICDGPEGQAILANISSNVQRSMNQAMSSFDRRIAAIKVKSEYSKALQTLRASDDMVNRFNNAVDTMMANLAEIESTFADYYMNPQEYLSVNHTTAEAVQQQIEQQFQTAFTNFQNGILSTDSEINSMKANVATAFGINQALLPTNFGKYYDFSGTLKNWPIPQTVLVNWIASLLSAGGSFNCTARDNTPIPAFALWIGKCSNPSFWDKGNCEANGGTWSLERHDFSSMTPSAAFNAYLGLQEDVQIIEAARYSIYQGGQQPTREQEKEARLQFAQRLEALATLITGTTNGTTAITEEQKKAVVKLLLQPSMD